MPLVYQQNINEHTKLGLWRITEPEDFFLEKVVLQQVIQHPHKRLQHLAGRYLLKFLFPDFPVELIQIADTRKPFLPEEPYHFSISHCSDYAAVIVSKNCRVGVDIELAQPKIMRIKDKFLTDAEMTLLLTLKGYPEMLLTLAWSVKEALFKWNAGKGIDFKKHLHIHAVQIEDEKFSVETSVNKNKEVHLKVRGRIMDELSLCWVSSQI